MNSDWQTDSGMIATISNEKKYIKTNGLEVDIQTVVQDVELDCTASGLHLHGLDPSARLQSENLKPYPNLQKIMDRL